ncbi:MAG: PAS domain-containing protein [Flavobacteriaceae bacterium]|nr:PAS domain-containing protein [Flavobacteriaceae bacterium]
MKNYPHIFNDTGIGTWKYNVQTGEIICNENWANMLGYKLSELEPMTSKKWADLFHPRFLDKSDLLLKEHFEGKTDFYQCEIQLKHRQGHWVWILAKGRLETRTPDGQPLLMVGTNQDITEKKNLIDTTEDKNKRLIDFAYIVSHNLRSHTGNIIMLIDIMATEMPAFAENEIYKNLKLASENLNDTVQRLNDAVIIDSKLNEI